MTIYKSTRGKEENISASQAIINGIASDGGLYIPSSFPLLPKPMTAYKDYSYQELAKEVLALYLTDFTAEEIAECVDKAYGKQFDCAEIAPVVKVGDSYVLELFHGPTYAFKDMALQILPQLMKTAAKKQKIDKEILILTATSGDTGKAAMEGFADVEGTKIMVFYPKNGVSFIQEHQMCSQQGENVYVAGIRGNFDDAQTGVKLLFQDKSFTEKLSKNGYLVSSANSINIGRLVPQIVYYIYAYAQLLKKGELQEKEKLDVVVPTGNFGNILAACYAKRMGVPLGVLLAASNQNKVIADFLSTGIYDKNREMFLTQSPSMDILVSSNLERLLFSVTSSQRVENYMLELSNQGKYEVTDIEKAKINYFVNGLSANEQECNQAIQELYRNENYLIDTHTAVAAAVANKSDLLKNKVLIVSTASPYKFSGSVLQALDGVKLDIEKEDFSLPQKLYERTKKPIPKGIVELESKPLRFSKVIDKSEMGKAVFEFLGI